MKEHKHYVMNPRGGKKKPTKRKPGKKTRTGSTVAKKKPSAARVARMGLRAKARTAHRKLVWEDNVEEAIRIAELHGISVTDAEWARLKKSSLSGNTLGQERALDAVNARGSKHSRARKVPRKPKNMAKSTKKPSAKQLAARAKFTKMVKAKAAARKKAKAAAGPSKGIMSPRVQKAIAAGKKKAAKKRSARSGPGAGIMSKDVQKVLDASRRLSKQAFVSKQRAEEAEKKLRSCRARVGAARKRGDLSKAQEEALKKKLELAKKAQKRCTAKAAKKATKKKAKKKATKKKKVTKRKAKKKATKKKAKKKVTKRKATKKKATKRKITKKKATKRKAKKRLTGSKKVSTKLAAKRKKAQPKKCKTGKRRAVKCKTRPTQIELDACAQAARRHGKSPSRTCGPGVPRGKKAAAQMGKRKAELEKLKKKQLAAFYRGG